MFPLRDENPTFNTSAVTFGLIGLNIAAWLFLQGMGAEPALSKSVCEFGAVPADWFGVSAATAAGSPCPIGERSALSAITSMFMHGGWFHLLGNMWFLYIFGDNVEDSMGPVRFLLFYLFCGLAAVAAETIVQPHSTVPVVGASGAIGGVMGAYAVLYPRAPVQVLLILVIYVQRIVVPAIFMLGFWLVLQVIGGLPNLTDDVEGGVAFWAHIGGFLAGVVLVFVFRNPARVAAHRALIAGRRQRAPQGARRH